MTRLTLKPGQLGDKALWIKYGDALVCVRFRYDPEISQRSKNIELIIEQNNWIPRHPCSYVFNANLETHNKAKSAGGRWNPEKQLLFVSYDNVVGTALEKYIRYRWI